MNRIRRQTPRPRHVLVGVGMAPLLAFACATAAAQLTVPLKDGKPSRPGAPAERTLAWNYDVEHITNSKRRSLSPVMLLVPHSGYKINCSEGDQRRVFSDPTVHAAVNKTFYRQYGLNRSELAVTLRKRLKIESRVEGPVILLLSPDLTVLARLEPAEICDSAAFVKRLNEVGDAYWAQAWTTFVQPTLTADDISFEDLKLALDAIEFRKYEGGAALIADFVRRALASHPVPADEVRSAMYHALFRTNTDEAFQTLYAASAKDPLATSLLGWYGAERLAPLVNDLLDPDLKRAEATYHAYARADLLEDPKDAKFWRNAHAGAKVTELKRAHKQLVDKFTKGGFKMK